ncbi:MAG: phage tail protein [Streptococcaceae bacterium]|jgi:phi13 family phage major tail protein|nr:phage tail protein [Streptococcaceae bacterium]
MATVGFEKLTIRVQDNATPTIGKNVFEISGKKDGGATATAKISGLASEPVKTYGSNKPYYVSSKGVGDAKIDLDIIDMPQLVLDAVLGLKADENGVVTATSETEAPYCSVLLEDSDIRGNSVLLGFMSGKFSYDGTDLETLQGKATELKPETISYAVSADDEGRYYTKYVGTTDTAIAAVKTSLGIVAGA